MRRLSDLHTSIVRSIPSGIITTTKLTESHLVNAAGAALIGHLFVGIGKYIPLHSIFPVIETGFSEGVPGRKPM